MNPPGVPETLITFVQVLVEDADLRAWFESFAEIPDAARAREFQQLAAKMQAAGEHGDLIQATALLGAPQVYDAARAALAEALAGRAS